MNRFIRNMLIAAAVCFAAGLVMSGCAAAVGGTFPHMVFGNSLVNSGRLGDLIGWMIPGSVHSGIAEGLDSLDEAISDGLDRVEEEIAEGRTVPYSEALNGIDEETMEKLVSLKDGDSLVSTYQLDEISDLKITAAPSRIVIAEGRTDGGIRVARTSDKIVLKDKLSNDSLELTFENAKKIWNLPVGEAVLITIPENVTFRKVELQASAASIEADRILAEELDITADAASVNIGRVSAEEMKLVANAASIEIPDGAADRLEISSAMGSVVYTGAVEKSIEADSSMGSVVITVDGNMKDFDYTLDGAMARIAVDGLEDTNSGKDKRTVRFDGASKTAELECEMGSLKLHFR